VSLMGARFAASAIAFDLDGVLVDSMPTIRAYWADWAQRHQRRPEDVLASLHLTAEELVRKFAPNLDATAEAKRTADGQAQMEAEILVFEGARELLSEMRPGSWGVVTSARRALAVRHLRLGGLPVPTVLITAEDTPRGKPDPSGYLMVASRLGFAPTDCVAIEDSPAGVRAARQAGMLVVAVANTHPREELTEADAVIDSLASLRVATAPETSTGLVVSLARTSTLL
jgi:sugar-phosphatase